MIRARTTHQQEPYQWTKPKTFDEFFDNPKDAFSTVDPEYREELLKLTPAKTKQLKEEYMREVK